MTDHLDTAKLDKLAEVAVRIGVNLQPDQDLIVTAPMEAAPLARRITVQAYKAGAGLVTVLYSDAEVTKARYLHGSDEGFDHAAGWLYEGMGKAYEAGTARLAITGDDPMLLKGMDPRKVARASKADSIARKPAMTPIVTMQTNWNIVAFPGAAWAAQVFPDMEPGAAQSKLLDAIVKCSRVAGPDPVQAWKDHTIELKKRVDWLNDQRFDALHYTGPGTDLTLGLAEGHIWKGGETLNAAGVPFQPNIPTEEVFSCPHAYRVDGTVTATKPLAHQGTLIENISVRFEAGKIVEATASAGEDVLRELMATDDGAARIGEVALVPAASPISQSGMLFFNTLFDENAASHIALGQSYADTVEGGNDLGEDELKQKGANQSLIHVDWMIGSDQIDIDGIAADGSRTPVMRGGNWA